MEGSTSLGWRTTTSKEKERGIRMEKWKRDACEAVDDSIRKWRAEEDSLLSGGAGHVRVPPCKAPRGHYDQFHVHGDSFSCVKERQQLLSELYVLKAKELAAEEDLQSAHLRINILEKNSSDVKDLHARVQRLLEENASLKSKLKDVRTEHTSALEELKLTAEIRKKLYRSLGYL